MLTLYNVKEFLGKGAFVTNDECRKNGNPKENPTIVKRISSRTRQEVQFHIYDAIERLKPDDWDRVVAVFAAGQAWQFRGWKWQEPVDLFHQSLDVVES